MIPILSIVGKSGSGKTTLLCKIIPELTKRGYRVSTIKHDAHRFDIDHPGKDSWLHKQSGAYGVIISSSEKYAHVQSVDSEPSIEEMASKLGPVDIIITEGYKTGDLPKIEVVRRAVSQVPITDTSKGLIAIISDFTTDQDVPHFALEAVVQITDFIEENFLTS